MLISTREFEMPSFTIVDNDAASNTTMYALFSPGCPNPRCLLVVQFRPGTGEPVAVGVMEVNADGISSDYIRQFVHDYRIGHCPVSGLSTLTERSFARTDRYVDHTQVSASHLNRLLSTSHVVETAGHQYLQHQDVRLLAMKMPSNMRIDEAVRMAEEYRVARLRLTMEQLLVEDVYKPRMNMIAVIANGAIVFPIKASNIAIVTFLGRGHVGSVMSSDQALQYELGIMEYTSYRTVCTLLKSYLY